MGGNDLEAAEIFLSSFNRIEKYLQNSFKLDKSIGFTNLVRKARANGDATIAKYEDDLIQIAQLRNAIVHETIAPDFIIAQPKKSSSIIPKKWAMSFVRRLCLLNKGHLC